MKRISALFITLVLTLNLCACTAVQSEDQRAEGLQAPTWQEQYDLGVRYLSEGNYEEAIIAFTAAIEIDPKQAPAFVRRGDAYVLSGETEANLAAAKSDYEIAIELDETNAEAYLGLADVYIRQGDYEMALEILQEGLEKIGENQSISDKLEELEVTIRPFDETLNKYDVTMFTLRDDYIEFDKMTAEQKTFVNTMAIATINGDADTLVQMRDNFSVFPIKEDDWYTHWNVYTIWEEYRIRLSYDISNYSDSYWIDAELRLENGDGHYIGYNNNGGHQYTEITVCPCTDWQWNGIMHRTFTYYTNTGKLGQLLEENGPVKDGVLDGEFMCTFLKGSEVNQYENGYQIARDGEPVENVNVSEDPGRTICNFNNIEERYW